MAGKTSPYAVNATQLWKRSLDKHFGGKRLMKIINKETLGEDILMSVGLFFITGTALVLGFYIISGIPPGEPVHRVDLVFYAIGVMCCYYLGIRLIRIGLENKKSRD